MAGTTIHPTLVVVATVLVMSLLYDFMNFSPERQAVRQVGLPAPLDSLSVRLMGIHCNTCVVFCCRLFEAVVWSECFLGLL